MTAAEFDRFLHHRLCWLDGMPTVASHAGQRQCPHCRRKWSYDALCRRWILAQEFCMGSTRRRAARRAGTDVHTAGRHFGRFQMLLAAWFTEQIGNPDGGLGTDAAEIARCCRVAMRTRDPRRRLVLMVDLCLRDMPTEARLDLVYRLAFRDRLHALINSALASRLRKGV